MRANPFSLKAFSPANQVFAKLTHQTIEIHRLDGTLLQTLKLSGPEVNEAAFSPDGQLLTARTSQGETRVWNVKTGQQLAQLKATNPSKRASFRHFSRDLPKSLVFSPNNSLLALAETPGTKNLVEVWSLGNTPRRVASLSQSERVSTMAFSPDNRALVCGSAGGSLRWYDVATQKMKAEVRNGSAMVWDIVFTPQGLVVGERGQSPATLTLYDVPSIRNSAQRPGGQKPLLQKKTQIASGLHIAMWDKLAISPQGRFFATASYSGAREIVVGHLSTGVPLARLEVDMFRVESIAFSPDGTRLTCIGHSMANGQMQVVSYRRPTPEKQTR
ncbi:MAG: WD40 repeat domain-containing protein [Armatimonadetes bacterium]|nr:WD40 repeat domain-containing protein [Armatimonadota bacterium]